MIDEDTVAIDFYDPTLMPEGIEIEYTPTWFENNKIIDMEYNYGTYDYRNKQIMTSDQVYANIVSQERILANGYQTQYNTEQLIGSINSILVDGVRKTFTTNQEKELGQIADFYYTPNNNYIESDDPLNVGQIITIEYVSIIQGRQIIINQNEISRIANSTGRNGTISRYENRNDATTSNELQRIGESYIKYKGLPEVNITIKTLSNIWSIGEVVNFDNAPLIELTTDYMVKSKKTEYIASVDEIFYEYVLTSSFNSEDDINYFDNQRAKAKGNIGDGEFVARNIDIESSANIIFYDISVEQIEPTGDNILNAGLNAPFVE